MGICFASFNTQPPEGGWGHGGGVFDVFLAVSTHSRLKAAGLTPSPIAAIAMVSTHSRLKAAGDGFDLTAVAVRVSTHSRLKAAGCAGTGRQL